MNKLLGLIALAVVPFLFATSCQQSAEMIPTKALSFNSDGRFKIVQFTDLHYRPGDTASVRGVRLINEVLDAEKPDLAVFTGDLIYGKPAKDALDELLMPVVERKIPWAVVFGNHDDEAGLSRGEIMDLLMQMPYCYALGGDTAIKGVGNYIIELTDSEKKQVKSLLYFFDSGAYTPIKGVGTYDWFHFSQVEWYRQKSESYTVANNKQPLPSLAFFHIPLPEYRAMATTSPIVGERRENECDGVLNTGMYAAMRESGDVMGTFVGHDHDNDYIGSYHNIALSYGRFSGGNTEYNNLGLNGCRIIEMEEGKRGFATYIRLLGGEKILAVDFPETFDKGKETE